MYTHECHIQRFPHRQVATGGLVPLSRAGIVPGCCPGKVDKSLTQLCTQHTYKPHTTSFSFFPPHQTHTYTHTLSLTHTHTHSLSLTHTRTHTHTLSHTHAHTHKITCIKREHFYTTYYSSLVCVSQVPCI